MKKTNPIANPKMGAPGSSNPRNGREMSTKMMGSNPATSQKSGAPGASNPRKGTVVTPSVYGPGGIQGKPKESGNPGSSNPRKGTMMKTADYMGEMPGMTGKKGSGSGSGNI